MVTAMNRIYSGAGVRRAVRAALPDTGAAGGRDARVRVEQGLSPVNPGDPYIVLTLWESRAAFDAWVKSDEFVKGHARSGTLPQEAFMQPSQLELHEGVWRDSPRSSSIGG